MHGSGQPSICAKLYKTNCEDRDDYTPSTPLSEESDSECQSHRTSQHVWLVWSFQSSGTQAGEHKRQAANSAYRVCCLSLGILQSLIGNPRVKTDKFQEQITSLLRDRHRIRSEQDDDFMVRTWRTWPSSQTRREVS